MKTDIRSQSTLYHPTLVDILEWLEDATGLEFTQTSTYRDGDSGTHGTIPLRACDVRCRITPVGKTLETLINNNWSYDPTRPTKKVALFHDVGQGRHLHIQVHKNTVRLR